MGVKEGLKCRIPYSTWAASNPCPSIKFEDFMLEILNIPEYSNRFFIFLHNILFFNSF
jgi:hypothetical protein